MYNHILIPLALDHQHEDNPSLEIAGRLLAPGGTITLLNVIEEMPAYVRSYISDETVQKTKDGAIAELDALAASIEGKSVTALVAGKPSIAILDYAERHKAECIVIASHKPGMQDYFLGSTAARVVRRARCCVHVLR